MEIKKFFNSLLTYTPPIEYISSLTDYQNKNEHAESTNFEVDNSIQKNKNIFSNINLNLDYMKTRYNLLINSDIVLREFVLNARGKHYNAFLVYIDGMIDTEIMDKFILEPLMLRNRNNLYKGAQNKIVSKTVSNNILIKKVKKVDLGNYITNSLMPQNSVKLFSTFEDIISGINSR